MADFKIGLKILSGWPWLVWLHCNNILAIWQLIFNVANLGTFACVTSNDFHVLKRIIFRSVLFTFVVVSTGMSCTLKGKKDLRKRLRSSLLEILC